MTTALDGLMEQIGDAGVKISATTQKLDAARIEEMLAKVKAASINDRKYERPMQWDDAEAVLTLALRALSPSHGEAVAVRRQITVALYGIDIERPETTEELLRTFIGLAEHNAKALARALSPDSLPLGGVKALVWRKRGELSSYEADSILGHYFAYEDGSWSSAEDHFPVSGNLLAAQAAAQAHYDKAILSALKPIEPERISEDWLDMSTAPKDGSQFLIWTKRVGFSVVRHDPEDEYSSASDLNPHGFCLRVEDGKFGPYPLRGDYPTHWKPLLNPPAALNGAVS